MPISSDFHPRSFIGKITKYKKVINVPTSVSVLEDLLPKRWKWHCADIQAIIIL